jgi:glutathione S-transferase
MKLYYLQGACSLASLICLVESGRKFEAISVERGTKKTADGKDFTAISPKGYVPALVLDDGQVLTENVAVLSYIASLNPAAKLGGTPGTLAQFRLIEALGYVNSELHKTISVVFRPDVSDDAKAMARQNAQKRLELVEKSLEKEPFLLGKDFSAADAYLYVVLTWNSRTGLDLSGLPRTQAFFDRVAARPSVKAALEAEGLRA